MTAPPSRLSRRALFGLGGSTLLVATAATAWRWRTSRAEAASPARIDVPAPYVDHDGWIVSVGEKRALQVWSATPPPGAR